MTEAIIIITLSGLLLGFSYLSYRSLKKKQRLRSAITLSLSALFLALNIFYISLILDKSSYERLTKEHTIATISFKKENPQQFLVTLQPAYSPPLKAEINGDQWQLDARILKWEGTASYLGLQPLYTLERLTGRYDRVQDEKNKPRTVIPIKNDPSISYWNTLIKYQAYIPWLDAYYGNAVYLPMANNAKFIITLGQHGLIARPRNFSAAQSVKHWILPEN